MFRCCVATHFYIARCVRPIVFTSFPPYTANNPIDHKTDTGKEQDEKHTDIASNPSIGAIRLTTKRSRKQISGRLSFCRRRCKGSMCRLSRTQRRFISRSPSRISCRHVRRSARRRTSRIQCSWRSARSWHSGEFRWFQRGIAGGTVGWLLRRSACRLGGGRRRDLRRIPSGRWRRLRNATCLHIVQCDRAKTRDTFWVKCDEQGLRGSQFQSLMPGDGHEALATGATTIHWA
mmetsp:Transcript_35686/g.58524  ORF Transcript_35686/g.58524 Transcript_35686/m.58524 type:complete len:233 (-) Transcript_35686:189-887(-)